MDKSEFWRIIRRAYLKQSSGADSGKIEHESYLMIVHAVKRREESQQEKAGKVKVSAE